MAYFKDFFILILLFSFFHSIATSKQYATLSVHDLISAIHRPPIRKSHSKNGNFTLSIFHRDTFSNQEHPTSHRHRINMLMNRDINRVAALTNKLSSQASIRYGVQDFGSTVVSGLEEGSGEYFIRIGVGSPPRDQFMVMDSGSDIVWVQCRPCSQCYRQSDPLFDPSESETFTRVPCRSPICGFLPDSSSSSSCGGGEDGRCGYEVKYGDGSYTKGTLALETLTFGTTSVQNIAIGCGHRNHGLFVGAAGLLGLGWGQMSFVGQLGGQAGGVFRYCLAGRGSPSPGFIVFGRSAAMPIGATWVPLLRNPKAPSYYFVGLAGLYIGGARLPIPVETFRLSSEGKGGTVLDSGTAVTRLPHAAYIALRDAFLAETVGLPRAPGVSIFDTCYDLAGYGSVRVPTVGFYFDGGTVLTLPARNYLIPIGGATFCFAFAASGSELSILGNIQQEGIQITVDSANGFLGFGPQTC